MPIFIGKCQPTPNRKRVPINIDPEVRERLAHLLWQPEMRGIGYSAFLNRAIDIAMAEIKHHRTTAQRRTV